MVLPSPVRSNAADMRGTIDCTSTDEISPVALLLTFSKRSPRSNVERRRRHPVVVHEQRRRRQVDRRAAQRLPDLHARRTGNEARHQVAVGIELRAVAGVELVVGLEDVAGRGLRIAADAGGDEVLEAALDLVRAGTARRQQLRDAAGQLAVVALFRIRRVEVWRVVLQRRRGCPPSCRASGTATRRC